jgi:hypothetical protein
MSDRMQFVVATPCFGQVPGVHASAILLQLAVHGKSNLELKAHLRYPISRVNRGKARRAIQAGRANLQFFRAHSENKLTTSLNRYAMSECMIDPATDTSLSEDFAFCKRRTDIGGPILADQSSTDHVEPAAFHGEVASQFARAAAADDAT